MEQRRWRDVIGPALFEATFVLLGVILALAANEWRQQRAEQTQARAALHEIGQELQANRAAIAAAERYHRGLVARIRDAKEGGQPLNGRDFQRGFIAPASIYSTAWTSAAATGVVANMPYETVLALSKLYAKQQEYRDQANSTGRIIYAELYRGGTQAIIDNADNLAGVIYTFVYRERDMLETFDAFFARSDLASLGGPPSVEESLP